MNRDETKAIPQSFLSVRKPISFRDEQGRNETKAIPQSFLSVRKPISSRDEQGRNENKEEIIYIRDESQSVLN